MYKYVDFRCGCGHKFEQMIKSTEERPESWPCPSCDKEAPRVLGAPFVATIRRGNHDFVERERERLTKRSQEHAKTKGREEAVERERAVMADFHGIKPLKAEGL